MKWNWQQPDWSDFQWDRAALAALEAPLLQQSGVGIGALKHLGDDDRTAFRIDLMTSKALKTSEIEGEILNRDSVQSSLRRQFGLDTDHRRIPTAERGIADIMVALYRGYAEPLSDERRYHRLSVSLASSPCPTSSNASVQPITTHWRPPTSGTRSRTGLPTLQTR